MIKNSKPISLAETQKYLKSDNEMNAELKGFIKKFCKIDAETAEKMRKEFENLELIKLKDEHISKIIDLFPETREDLDKIFIDIGLDENEANKILEKIKEFE